MEEKRVILLFNAHPYSDCVNEKCDIGTKVIITEDIMEQIRLKFPFFVSPVC